MAVMMVVMLVLVVVIVVVVMEIVWCCESGVGGSVNISRGNASDGNGYGGERYERTVDVMIGGEKEGGDG